jgi:2-iminobutanoate/2-iminopropanoate deaminase
MKRNILTFTIAATAIVCGVVSVHGQTNAIAAQKPTIERRIVQLPGSSPSRAPISPAIVAGDFVFTSGQIGIDPKTGQMVPGGLEAEAEQVLKNLTAVLEAAGSSISHVLKATVFLADMNDYAAMNEIYRRHFKQDFPARSAVQVARLPANAKIEIEAVAILKK